MKQGKITPKTSGNKTIAQATRGVTSVLSQGMAALWERGEKLDNKTAQLHNDAAKYAEMAKQLKEKNQKKSKFLGF